MPRVTLGLLPMRDRDKDIAEQHRWVQQLEDLVHRAQSDGAMRLDVRADDIMHVLNVFTCHPDALLVPVAAKPMKYLHFMLDGMQTSVATPPPARHDTETA